MNERVMEMLKELHPELDFAGSDDFVDDGFLDSFDVVALVDMLEEEYSVRIDGMEIIPENFASIDSIVSLVNKSKGRD